MLYAKQRPLPPLPPERTLSCVSISTLSNVHIINFFTGDFLSILSEIERNYLFVFCVEYFLILCLQTFLSGWTMTGMGLPVGMAWRWWDEGQNIQNSHEHCFVGSYLAFHSIPFLIPWNLCISNFHIYIL